MQINQMTSLTVIFFVIIFCLFVLSLQFELRNWVADTADLLTPSSVNTVKHHHHRLIGQTD